MLLSNGKIGIVILAAGQSSRLGFPKQLLVYNGKTLLRHAIDEAVNANADYVAVVVGANAALLINEIDTDRVTLVENTEWQQGMASSLIAGLKAFTQQMHNIDGVVFMVCDQPFISTAILNNLIARYRETGKPVVASNYGETIGTPAFFDQSLFTILMQLKEDEGARKIIKQHHAVMETIMFLEGDIDIDRKEDYESIIKG